MASLLARDARLSPSGLLRKEKFTFSAKMVDLPNGGKGFLCI